MSKIGNYVLSNGVEIPSVGLGTWQAEPNQAYQAVLDALEAGYRHIDTAYVYGNEVEIGKAIKDSGIKREEIFITTKLPSHIKNYKETFEYFKSSCKALGVDYLDLYLIHAPWPWSNVGEDCTQGNIEVWKAFIELYNAKKIRSIGVSNFHPKDIISLIEATSFTPHVNQIRYFIGNTQKETTRFCQENNILVEAYSPFATGKILDEPYLIELSNRLGVSIPKICLKYCLQRGTLPLPKSVHKERIIQNIELDFEIPEEDLIKLDAIDARSELKRPFRS